MNKLTLCLLSLALPALTHAQDVLDESEEVEIRRYTVEVIIFRYAQDVGVGSEVFLPDAPLEPELGDALDLLEELDEQPLLPADGADEAKEETEPLPDSELVLLDEESYQLLDAYGRLERLDAYEPLMHFGWTQATWPEEQTEAIPLHLFGRPPAELDGTLKLYLGRYLHLVAELQLQAPGEVIERSAPQSGFNGYSETVDAAGDLVSPPVFFRINEDRILRNGELRYYDHPKFGMLVTATRVENTEEQDPGELLGYPIQ
jgi:hypothetical protein